MSRRATTQERFFCQTAISVKQLPVVVSVFCIVCELETPKLAVFSRKHPAIARPILEETYDIYYAALYRQGDFTIM